LEDVSFGSDDCWLYYPAIMADSASNMVIVYNQSCTDEYIGIRYTGRTPTDVALQPSAELKAGEANYVRTASDGRNRWGDYNGIALDPTAGNRIWMFAEYAKDPSSTWGTWFGQVIPTTLGDINDDGVINVADVVLLVDFILEISTPTALEFVSADCTPDTSLDIGDVVCIVNLILGPGPAQLLAAAPAATSVRGVARLDEAPVDPITGQRTVMLEADLGTGTAGIQARLEYDPGRVRVGTPELTDRANGFRLQSRDLGGELIVLVYGEAGDVLAAGEGPLMRLPVFMQGSDDEDPGLELTQMRLADLLGIVRSANVGTATLTTMPNRFRLSEPYPNPIGLSGTQLDLEIPQPTTPSLSGESGIVGSSGTVHVVVEVFNVRGQKIRTVMAEDLAPGRHAIRWDGRSDRGTLVGAGLYVMRMRAGTVVETRKLIVSNR
jgi:hypothetical protein